jgi:hypothetical protein
MIMATLAPAMTMVTHIIAMVSFEKRAITSAERSSAASRYSAAAAR